MFSHGNLTLDGCLHLQGLGSSDDCPFNVLAETSCKDLIKTLQELVGAKFENILGVFFCVLLHLNLLKGADFECRSLLFEPMG